MFVVARPENSGIVRITSHSIRGKAALSHGPCASLAKGEGGPLVLALPRRAGAAFSSLKEKEGVTEMPGNTISINKYMDFYVGDSKMPALMKWLRENGIRQKRSAAPRRAPDANERKEG